MGWNISIDDETGKHYLALTDEYAVGLCGKLEKAQNEFMFRLEPGENCPALNEDGLCEIYIRYGENRMSKTCQLFPRTVLGIDDFDNDFRILSNECEEVLRMLYDTEAEYEIITEIDGNERKGTAVEKMVLFSKWAASLLQDVSIPLEIGLASVLYVGNSIVSLDRTPDCHRIEEEIRLSQSLPEQLSDMFCGLSPNDVRQTAWKKIEGIIATYIFVMKNSNHSIYEELLPEEEKGIRFEESWDSLYDIYSDYMEASEEKRDIFFRRLFANFMAWNVTFLFNPQDEYPFMASVSTAIVCIMVMPALWDRECMQDRAEYISRLSLLHRTMRNKPFLEMVRNNIELDIVSVISVLGGLYCCEHQEGAS